MSLARSAPRRVSRRRPPPDRVPHVAGLVVATFLAVAVCAALLLGCRTDAVGDATSEPSRPAPRPTTPRTAPATTPPGSVPEPEPGTTESTNPPSTARPVDPRDLAFTPEQREVIDAYRDARDAILESNAAPSPNPDHPKLAETMVDPAFSLARSTAEGNRAMGHGFRLRMPSRRASIPKAVSLIGHVAEVNLCSIDDTVTFDIDTGGVVNDTVLVSDIKARLVRSDGRWRLAERELVRQTEGDPDRCDV